MPFVPDPAQALPARKSRFVPDGQEPTAPDATALDRVNAVDTGFNAGLAALAGLPVDTAANIIDLGKAGLGTAYSEITGKAVPKALEVDSDRSDVIGSTAWIRKYLDRNAITNTEASRPDDKVSQYLHAGASALPGLALGGAPNGPKAAAIDVVEAFGLGTVPQAVADAGGNEGMQAAAGALAATARPVGAAAVRAVAAKAVPKPRTVDPNAFLEGQKGMSREELHANAVQYLRDNNVLVDEGQAAPAGTTKGNALRGLSRGADTVFGTGKFPVRQGESFVRAVLKTAGLEGATRATPDALAEIHKSVEAKYNQLHDTVPTILDQPFREKLETFREQAKGLLGDSSPEFQALSKQIDNLYEKGQLTPEAKAAQEAAAKQRIEADRVAKRRSELAAARQADAEAARQQTAERERAAKAQAETDRVAELRRLGVNVPDPAPVPVAPPKPKPSAVEEVTARHAAEDAAAKERQIIEADSARVPTAPEPDRIISGRAAQAARENLAKLQGGSASGVARDLAGELKELLDDAFENSTTQENIDAMRDARRQFHRMKQIEEAVAGRPDGIVTPERLMQVMSTKKNRREAVYGKGEQELMNLARAGKMVLPENLGNSGTASREMDVAKVAAVLTNPVLAAKVGGTLLGGRALNRRGAENKTAEAVQANIDRINEINKRRAARSMQHGPEPKVGSALTTESPEERKRRMRAEALRK